MRINVTKIGAALLCLGWLACAATTVQAQPERLSFGVNFADRGLSIGGSFVPPAGDGWQLTRPGGGFDLLHAGASDQENSQIEAYLIRMDQPFVRRPEYLAKLKENIQNAITQDGGLQVQSLDLAFDAKLTQCIRIHQLLLKKAATNSDRPWYSEQYILSCGFAAMPSAGVELRYDRRYFADHKDAAFAAQAKSVLDSFELTDVIKK